MMIRAIGIAAGILAAAPAMTGPSPVGPQGPDRAPTKWALLVGIDEYKSPSLQTLRGATNDVRKMQNVLVGKYEFPEQNVRMLLNAQATHEAIVSTFRNHLIQNAREGDIVVFHFSGHGSRMRDQEGAGKDETDGYDETIVPYDSRVGSVYDITDDELNGLSTLLAQKTDFVTFILDSCHSGTGTRASGRVRAVATDTRPPPPPPPYAQGGSTDGDSGLRDQGANFVLLAGSRSDQVSREFTAPGSGVTHGAFTHFLTEELDRTKPGATYLDVMDKVRGRIGTYYPDQSPQLEGAGVETVVFSDATAVSEPYVLTTRGPSGAIGLRAGAVHGVTAGSVYDVYRPGTKSFGPEASTMARVRVVDVNPFESTAEVVSGGAVPRDARAVEREHAFADPVLLVHYQGLTESSALQSVRDSLARSVHVREHPEASGYTLLLREEADGVLIEGPDTVPLSAPVSVHDPDHVEQVVRLIRDWARWYNILAIDNPSGRLTIDLVISKADSPGTRAEELRNEDMVTITMTNRSDQDLFVTLIDLSTDGSVCQVFPNPMDGGAELLPAGQNKVETTSVFVPEERRSVRDHLKVIATTREADFRTLLRCPLGDGQDQADSATRSLSRGMASPLERLLDQAAIGTRSGEGTLALGDWTVAQTTFRVRR